MLRIWAAALVPSLFFTISFYQTLLFFYRAPRFFLCPKSVFYAVDFCTLSLSSFLLFHFRWVILTAQSQVSIHPHNECLWEDGPCALEIGQPYLLLYCVDGQPVLTSGVCSASIFIIFSSLFLKQCPFQPLNFFLIVTLSYIFWYITLTSIVCVCS